LSADSAFCRRRTGPPDIRDDRVRPPTDWGVTGIPAGCIVAARPLHRSGARPDGGLVNAPRGDGGMRRCTVP
jgi:hypothetical protein